tara:strand:- start:677 stop:937 length:261 start_codon:yes stop_codon:yes gene_type:complete
MAKIKELHREIERLNQESSHYQDLYNQQLEKNSKLESEKTYMEKESFSMVQEISRIKGNHDLAIKTLNKYQPSFSLFGSTWYKREG